MAGETSFDHDDPRVLRAGPDPVARPGRPRFAGLLAPIAAGKLPGGGDESATPA